MADVRMLLLFCLALAAPTMSRAEPMRYEESQRIEATVAAVTEAETPEARGRAAASVMAGFGLKLPSSDLVPDAPSGFQRQPGAVIEMVNIRLLLAQIAVQSGARDHQALVRAQGDRVHDVILLRGGFVSAGDLVALARDSAARDFVAESAEGIVLLRPLVIWSDAGLSLGAGTTLALDRQSGSFLANFGWLDLDAASILGSDAASTAEPAFRPFVLTAGRGRMTARGASFQSLGFGASPVFGGVSVVNNGLHVPDLPSVLAGSRLDDVTTLAFIGTTGASVTGTTVTAASGTALLVSRATEMVVAANRIDNGGRDAQSGGQGIRVTAGSRQVEVAGNHLTGITRTGIAIDDGSEGVSVTGNVLAGGKTTGIAVRRAGCVQIAGNLIAQNGGSAISLTRTADAEVGQNALLFNQGSGVLIRDQDRDARVRVTGNVLVGNAEGFRGATPGNPDIAGNNLDGQFARVFAGDLAHLTAGWLRGSKDASLQPVRSDAMACDLPAGGG